MRFRYIFLGEYFVFFIFCRDNYSLGNSILFLSEGKFYEGVFVFIILMVSSVFILE